MDLLWNAYSNVSDDEEQPKRQRLSSSSSNLPKRHLPLPSPPLFHQTQSPIPGSYISKRQRSLMGPTPVPLPDSVPVPSPFTLPAKDHHSQNLISEKLSATLSGHTNAVNAIHWSSTHAHLLASAGMDHTICIWNVWSRNQKKACMLNFHNAAVKDVKWSPQGHFLLSCGYDCTSRLVDVEKGLETQVFREDQIVAVIKFDPDNSNIFLSGGSKGHIKLWDVRTGKVVHNYNRNLGPILDLEFTMNGKQFISSCDVSQSNISENAIIVWDVAREVPLSNQVYAEAYTCPCVRLHPFDSIFVAQSNGNYVAIFTSTPPYRLNKYKRYEGHVISGFPIKCNFSLDGKKLASGSSDGSIFLYDYQSSKVVKKIKAHDQACIDVAFHPIIPNVIASCSWDGSILVFE
ncbi:WD repeat-containing protein 25 isoform X2 [Vigna radiata var. radiata]|uniref:WD repeat-containing protein 25 isoform X2 n=1 Tax=Vigna radiata var. radiata TaxID=3916 RepID=A0A1S3TDH8_VIGRR|nr:WD repeat-containing protein 25 isoform X2 [Vigna radiata var. radiata]